MDDEPELPFIGMIASGQSDISEQMSDFPFGQPPPTRTVTFTITAAKHGRGFYVHWGDKDGNVETVDALSHFALTFTGTVDQVETRTAVEADQLGTGWVPTTLDPEDPQ